MQIAAEDPPAAKMQAVPAGSGLAAAAGSPSHAAAAGAAAAPDFRAARVEEWLQQPAVVLQQPGKGEPSASAPALSSAGGSQLVEGSLEWSQNLLLMRAEVQLRCIRRRKQQFQQLVADLGVQSARIAAQVVLAAQPARTAGRPPRPPPRPQRASVIGQTRRRSEAEAGPGNGQAAQNAGDDHDPSTCTMAGCLWCAAHQRMLANLVAPAASGGAASTRPRRGKKAQEGQEGQPQQQAAAPPAPAPQAAEQLPPEQQLMLAYPRLDSQVCAAVCGAFPEAGGALGAPQHAMAAWLAGSGARTAGEVVSILDSSQQVWAMALAATADAGCTLLHWVALLNACK